MRELEPRRRRQFLAGACKGFAVQLRNYAEEHAASDALKRRMTDLAADADELAQLLRDIEASSR